MGKITKIIFQDNIRSKIVIFYFCLLALLSWTSMLLQDNEAKGALTMLNIVLFIVPLMSLLYTIVYLYDTHNFIVLLLSQPVTRQRVWWIFYCGIAGGLLIAYLLGAGIPVMLFASPLTAALQLLAGCVSTLVFVSLAFLITMLTSEKTRGIGAGLLIWLLLTMIYDSVLLYLVFLLGEYPIERPLMGLLMLNPLDLVRFQIILQMDASAMMGYSGAAMKEFLGATGGMIVSAFLLTVWAALPYALSLRLFRKKDL